VELARQQLEQSRDRFADGVTNNVEVVQAQEAVAAANESYIASLYSFNAAKTQVARARGDAGNAVIEYLKGKH
jgi:outer membrane protein TolC